MESSIIVIQDKQSTERPRLLAQGYTRRCVLDVGGATNTHNLRYHPLLEVWRRDENDGIILASRRRFLRIQQARGLGIEALCVLVAQLERDALALLEGW